MGNRPECLAFDRMLRGPFTFAINKSLFELNFQIFFQESLNLGTVSSQNPIKIDFTS